MNSRDFVYWLQGFFEMEELGPKKAEKLVLTADQVECIKRHLHLVFKHDIDPSYGDADHQKVLKDIHSGLKEINLDLPYDPTQTRVNC